MFADKQLELRDGYVYFRPQPGIPISLSIHALQDAVTLCAEHQCLKLLINLSDITQQPPSIIEIYTLAAEANKVWDRRLQTVVVDPTHWLKLNSFVATVARNRGINALVFLTEEEAREWLFN